MPEKKSETRQEEKKSLKNFPLQTVMQVGMILLLIVASFFIGMLWTKVQYLEKGGLGKGAGTGANANTGTNPANPQNQGATKSLTDLAGEIKLDTKAFKSCLDSGEMAKAVSDDQQTGTKAGVQGTPGNILLDTQTKKAFLVPGAVPWDMLKPAVDDFIAGKTPQIQAQALSAVTDLAPVTQADFVKGNRNSKFALVEYSDFQCPYCKRFMPTANQLLTEYKNFMWVYRQFPLTQLHPNAQKMAEASECAAKLGGNDAFWAYADKLGSVDAVLPQ